MVKIALIGTHGTGKSTIVYDIVNRLKKQKINAEPLKEVARDCPLPINEDATIKSQEWIIFQQYLEEIKEERRSELVVCDRSVLDGYVYYYKMFGKSDLLEKFVKEKIQDYAQIWKVPIEFSKLNPDGIRSTDKEFQVEIDRCFNEILNSLGIEYKEFKGEQDLYENIINEFNKDSLEKIQN